MEGLYSVLCPAGPTHCPHLRLPGADEQILQTFLPGFLKHAHTQSVLLDCATNNTPSPPLSQTLAETCTHKLLCVWTHKFLQIPWLVDDIRCYLSMMCLLSLRYLKGVLMSGPLLSVATRGRHDTSCLLHLSLEKHDDVTLRFNCYPEWASTLNLNHFLMWAVCKKTFHIH